MEIYGEIGVVYVDNCYNYWMCIVKGYDDFEEIMFILFEWVVLYNDFFYYFKVFINEEIFILFYDLFVLENNMVVVEIFDVVRESVKIGKIVYLK